MHPATASIADLYDTLVADHYDDDTFGIITKSRELALAQLVRSGHVPRRVCDFGMGTGDCLLSLRERHPNAELWGVDLSARMVQRARSKLSAACGLRGISLHEGDALDARRYLPASPIDLAITHFLLAYVDAQRIAAEVTEASESGGLWSIVTSTSDSFPALAALARRFLPPESQPELHTKVPERIEDLEIILAKRGWEIRERIAHTHPIALPTFDALVHFARHSGWFTSEALARFSDAEIEALRPTMEDIFPIADEARVAVVLCCKR